MSLLSTKVRPSIDTLVVEGSAPLRIICGGVATASTKATALPAGGLFNFSKSATTCRAGGLRKAPKRGRGDESHDQGGMVLLTVIEWNDPGMRRLNLTWSNSRRSATSTKVGWAVNTTTSIR